MKRGDIIAFYGHGILYEVLSRLLKLFEPWWDRKCWHTAIIFLVSPDGCYLLESQAQGVNINFYQAQDLKDTRLYRWFDSEPAEIKMEDFLAEHNNERYDVGLYFWTMAQYLIRHFFNHRIPRLLNNRYTCWELVFRLAEELDHPIGSPYDCPLLTDFLKHYGGDVSPDGIYYPIV